VRAALLACCLALGGCATGAHTVATDVKVIEKPVPVPCKFEWPQKPVPHVELVQLTGDIRQDLVLIERAKEAELEERIAYEIKFEAAAQACSEPPKPK
jgi:hypothetical protein